MAASISYMAETDTGEFAGISLHELRRRYQSVMNIPADAVAFVNDREVTDEAYVVQDGDKVTFKSKVMNRAA